MILNDSSTTQRLHGVKPQFPEDVCGDIFQEEGRGPPSIIMHRPLHSGPAKNRLPKFAEVCRNLVSSKDQLPYNSLSLLHVHMPFISYEHYTQVVVQDKRLAVVIAEIRI